MKKLIIIAILCSACGGKLSDEQRQKLHEGMATQDIKRVSEADLQEAALVYAKSVLSDITKVDKYLNQKSKIDSIAAQHHVRIYSLIPNDSTLREIEKQLVEAYITGADTGQAGDNLQLAFWVRKIAPRMIECLIDVSSSWSVNSEVTEGT